jgi:hypothetical protein
MRGDVKKAVFCLPVKRRDVRGMPMSHQTLELDFQKIEFFQQPADDDKIAQMMMHRIDHRHPLPIQFPLGR